MTGGNFNFEAFSAMTMMETDEVNNQDNTEAVSGMITYLKDLLSIALDEILTEDNITAIAKAFNLDPEVLKQNLNLFEEVTYTIVDIAQLLVDNGYLPRAETTPTA